MNEDGGMAQATFLGGAELPETGLPDAGLPVEGANPQEQNAGANTQNAGTPTAAPEQYAPFTLPEGSDANDARLQGAMSEAQTLFKELNLTQEQAQKVWDLGVKHWMGGAVEAEEMFNRQVAQQIAQWGEELKRDPEIGGARLKENLALAQRAVAYLGGLKLADALNKTGVGNHPVIVAAFAKMGRDFLSEDRFVRGSSAKPATTAITRPEDIARVMYPNM